MKCIAQTSRWAVKPCPNNAKCDGYCYAHHPSVVLAKLRLYARSGLPYLRNYQLAGPDMPIQAEIEKQEALLSTLTPANLPPQVTERENTL